MDSLNKALGGDREDDAAAPAAPAPPAPLPIGTARHIDPDAPPERMEDAMLVTGGKHRA
jgi:hypothetical protein